MMKVMALKILREIAANIRDSDFYAMMCDEATDVANTSQLVVCLRWVDEDLIAHDEYIGLKDMSDTSAQAIVKELKDVLLRRWSELRRIQHHDRFEKWGNCPNKEGGKTSTLLPLLRTFVKLGSWGCNERFKGIERHHRIDTTFELKKLIKKSPKRNAKLIGLQNIVNEDTTSNDDVGILIRA